MAMEESTPGVSAGEVAMVAALIGAWQWLVHWKSSMREARGSHDARRRVGRDVGKSRPEERARVGTWVAADSHFAHGDARSVARWPPVSVEHGSYIHTDGEHTGVLAFTYAQRGCRRKQSKKQ